MPDYYSNVRDSLPLGIADVPNWFLTGPMLGEAYVVTDDKYLKAVDPDETDGYPFNEALSLAVQGNLGLCFYLRESMGYQVTTVFGPDADPIALQYMDRNIGQVLKSYPSGGWDLWCPTTIEHYVGGFYPQAYGLYIMSGQRAQRWQLCPVQPATTGHQCPATATDAPSQPNPTGPEAQAATEPRSPPAHTWEAMKKDLVGSGSQVVRNRINKFLCGGLPKAGAAGSLHIAKQLEQARARGHRIVTRDEIKGLTITVLPFRANGCSKYVIDQCIDQLIAQGFFNHISPEVAYARFKVDCQLFEVNSLPDNVRPNVSAFTIGKGSNNQPSG